MNGENSLETYILLYIKQQEGISCVTPGAQPVALRGWEMGRGFRREGIDVYL